MPTNRVLVITINNQENPSIRYRMRFPLEELKKKCGEEALSIKTLCFYSKRTAGVLSSYRQFFKLFSIFLDLFHFGFHLVCNRESYDIIFVQTYTVPFGGSWIEKLVATFMNYSKMVYDIDDGNYLVSSSDQNRFFSKFRDSERKIGFWIEKADMVLACNPIIIKDLIDIYGLEEKKIRLYTTFPFKEQYFENVNEIEYSKSSEKIRFVWLGSPETQHFLKLCEKLITEIILKIRNAEFYLIGTAHDFIFMPEYNNIHFIKWSIENEIFYMKQAHFGINPLNNSSFEQRKCAFKVIQYYRAGVIPIASSVGINTCLIQEYGGYCSKYLVPEEVIDFVNQQIDSGLAEESKKLYCRTKLFSVEENANILEELLFTN